jgi:AraC-like DNA-binding protein
MAYLASTFHSDDRDVTEQWLSAAYGHVALDRTFRDFNQHVTGDDRFLVTDSRWHGPFAFTADVEQFVVVDIAPGGSPWHDPDGGGDLSSAPALVRPGSPFSTRNDVGIRSVVLEPAAMRRTARLLYGQDDLQVRFDGAHPANPGGGEHWRALLEMARSSADAGLLRNDLVRASTYRLLAVSALEEFRLIGDRRELHDTAERRRAVYRSGAEFLTAFASLPITVDDAAEAAGASVPELVDAFRAHTAQELTPTVFLRNIRLDAALADLQAADPTLGDTVAEIAHRWGFASPSRFAAHFRAAFGVAPKWVLDR